MRERLLWLTEHRFDKNSTKGRAKPGLFRLEPAENREKLGLSVVSRLVGPGGFPNVRFLPVESKCRPFTGKGILHMNKNELVSAVAEAAKLSKGDAQSAVDAVFSVISDELKKGGDVRLVGFGNFSVSKREASTGRNPQTGAEVQIPARNVPKFSAGKGLKDAVN